MKRYRIVHVLAFLATSALVMPRCAYGQVVDYSSFESLYGQPITVNATGTPQRSSDVPANMTIITAEEIRQSGSRNIPEIISRVPGLDILRSSVNMYDLGVRGYQQPFQPRLLVLIDGRQVFNDDYSRTEWGNLPVNVDDIRQIEVIKGANSALFGSNAAGGVINIITYSPLYDNNKTANVSYGTQNTKSGDATFTQHLGEWGGVKVSAGAMGGDNFDTSKPPGESRFDNKPQHQYASSNGVFGLNSDLKANFEVTYSNSKQEGADLGYNLQNSVDTNYSIRGGFSWQTPYGLVINNNYFNHDYELADFSLTPHLNSLVDLYTSSLEDQFRIGKENTFRLAIEYRRKSINQSADNSVVQPQNDKLDDDVYAASATWLWQINDKLSWTNAARVDHSAIHEGGTLDPNSFVKDYDHSINAFSGNSGLVYRAADLDTFRLTYGRGIQLPSMIQNGVWFATPIVPGVVVNVEGNPALKPTIIDNYEFNYERGLPDIGSTVKWSVYYETSKDSISPPRPISSSFINGNVWLLEQALNVGDSHSIGSEIELMGKSQNGFRWDASYSWASVSDAQAVANTLGYEESTPVSHFRVLLGYTTGPWELDTNGQLVTSKDMLRNFQGTSYVNTPTAGYTSLSARIGYKLTDEFTLSLSGTNLAQAYTQNSPYPAIERQVFLGLTGHF